MKESNEKLEKIYEQIIDPYIILFSNIENEKIMQQIQKTITSYEYRKTTFKLYLIGSDGVIKAYNDLMRFAFLKIEPKKLLLA